MTRSTADATACALPRILCLHGGGVNATVFRMQCRALIARLGPSLRLVFADAPFATDPHEAIVGVYGDHGPFFRWLRWQAAHPELESGDVAARIVAACRRAMDDDAGCGAWVGVLGFSQGAKIAASLLWAQERLAADEQPPLLARFRFGVLMAGSPPVVRLDARVPPARHVADAAHLSLAFDDWPEGSAGPHALGIPTVHVHGLLDPGLERHRRLLESYARPGTARLVEWQGSHRLPIKTRDVEAVATQILQLAELTGAL
ncbi:Esterase LovG [Tolypocladium ophioglossoides CBS 100239]|uniref:Esterase LovG n=1 Tax=Tolypocladium ophioglossoides (strain CBS 100239) TaxID=1163406 RepID=A0A0L0N109_TOLOC|nr:Esterase LovG [Tolypocladium ophioglossoides CBS 100239]